MTTHLPELTRQIEILHFSDLHFGSHHRFQPEKTPMSDRPKDPGFPSLADKILEDLTGETSASPVIICATGDFAEIADVAEFKQAEVFFQRLLSSPILGKKIESSDIFIVPGNHDVVFDNSDIGIRFQQYTEFHNRLYGQKILRENPWDFCHVYDLADSHGIILACVNSSIYVQKGVPDQDRGNLDVKQLTILEETLEKIDRERLRQAIKIALVHHHPVLVPALAEPGRGYDAIHNSGLFLSILKRYGFHAVLHGHKHNPHTFTDDTKAAYTTASESPMFFSCVGSLGSKELPVAPGMTNCYNRLTIKWHANGKQFRVRCLTRGLSIYNDDGTERLPTRWRWRTMRIFDRHFVAENYPLTLTGINTREFESDRDDAGEESRRQIYEDTRGCLPVVEVRPSLVPKQAYEAVVWIAKHPLGRQKSEKDDPIMVTWSAGSRFHVKEVAVTERSNFAVSFNYWGPMLIQARIKFADGKEALAYVYAYLPVGDIVAE